MFHLPISNGFVALIDDCDVEAVTARNWYVRPPRGPGATRYVYATSKKVGGRRSSIFLHRFIMEPPAGFYIDHINGDGLDNRRCNLRLATVSQNNANRPNVIKGQSGYRGVHRSNHGRSWRAMVGSGPQRYRGPHRETAGEAALDYDAEAVRRFGEFAILNFATPDCCDNGKCWNNADPTSGMWVPCPVHGEGL